MGKPTNVRIDRDILDRIDQLHSGAFSRSLVIDTLLCTAIDRWEKWLIETGEIKVCKERRVGEYIPIMQPERPGVPYSQELLDAQRKQFEQ